jgi:CRP/FNR family transcriptional regulator, cyclic AMP receptor protein
MTIKKAHGPQQLLLIEKVLLLKSVDIFSETPETVLTEVAEVLEEIELPMGADVFLTGDIGNCMYIISRGEISIHRDGRQLAVLQTNEVFGELSLLDTETRSASASVLSDCLLLKIDQEQVYEIMETRVEVARGIIKTLCKRIRNQNAVKQDK